MTILLELKPELDADLKQLAKNSGLPLEVYLARLIEESIPASPGGRAVALLDSWREEDATHDPEVLEQRRVEWEAFGVAMNEGHTSDRIVFP